VKLPLLKAAWKSCAAATLFYLGSLMLGLLSQWFLQPVAAYCDVKLIGWCIISAGTFWSLVILMYKMSLKPSQEESICIGLFLSIALGVFLYQGLSGWRDHKGAIFLILTCVNGVAMFLGGNVLLYGLLQTKSKARAIRRKPKK